MSLVGFKGSGYPLAFMLCWCVQRIPHGSQHGGQAISIHILAHIKALAGLESRIVCAAASLLFPNFYKTTSDSISFFPLVHWYVTSFKELIQIQELR